MHNHSHTANFRILALNACLSAGISSRFNCCSAGNPRTVTPLQNAQYSVTVLDAQLRPAIKRYHLEVVSLQAELVVALAPGDFCGNGPITLRVEGALPHCTYRWSTGETTSEIQVPLSGMAAAYRVTVADARQDGAGVWKTCEQALEIRTAEALAAVEAQKCELLFSRLEALGFEAREVKIVEPVQAIAPHSRASATCNVVDHTDFRVEWYEETRTPASILCSELAEMEGVTQGFIYASDDICTEADLAEVEALINDETLLHVYLKPCGGEEYGVLMEKGQASLNFQIDLSPEKIIENEIDILKSSVVANRPINLRLITRNFRNPPNTEDLMCRTDGDCNKIRNECMTRIITYTPSGFPKTDIIQEADLWRYMYDLMDACSTQELDPVTKAYMTRFKQNNKADYVNLQLAEAVRKSPEMINYIKKVGLQINELLPQNSGKILNMSFNMPRDARLQFSNNYNLIHGLKILINDTENNDTYYVGNFRLDEETGIWSGDFYFEITDHFGLDRGDVMKYQYAPGAGGIGFAAWWALQHRKAYCPFKTKIRILATIQGKLK
jgi:hypothetical protein